MNLDQQKFVARLISILTAFGKQKKKCLGLFKQWEVWIDLAHVRRVWPTSQAAELLFSPTCSSNVFDSTSSSSGFSKEEIVMICDNLEWEEFPSFNHQRTVVSRNIETFTMLFVQKALTVLKTTELNCSVNAMERKGLIDDCLQIVSLYLQRTEFESCKDYWTSGNKMNESFLEEIYNEMRELKDRHPTLQFDT
jgi:hypothetical protein